MVMAGATYSYNKPKTVLNVRFKRSVVANKMTIEQTSANRYTVSIAKQIGEETTIVKFAKNVAASDLIGLFENVTGIFTKPYK